jgi:hypothetical protein
MEWGNWLPTVVVGNAIVTFGLWRASSQVMAMGGAETTTTEEGVPERVKWQADCAETCECRRAPELCKRHR